MSECFDATAVIACHNGQPAVVHYVHDHAGRPKVLITDVSGVVIPGATSANTTPGACPLPGPDQFTVTGGGAMIAGAGIAGTAEFAGAVDVWDTSAVPDRLHSMTVAARGVVDGLPGLSADQVTIDMPDGTTIALMNGETRTFSVARNSDNELRRDYRVRAFGLAYANITYTFT